MFWTSLPDETGPQDPRVSKSSSTVESFIDRFLKRGASSSGSVAPELRPAFSLPQLRGGAESATRSRAAGAVISEDVEAVAEGSAYQPPWMDPMEFTESERSRRVANSLDGAEKAFVSHCWRDPETQERKRRLLDQLSKRPKDGGIGLHYWADYLDLQAEGPVPWRSEIEAGIAACSKFVAVVDKAWLTSYNCLQELALACQHSKPLVILVLTQEAWDLLTIPGGAETVKSEADRHYGPGEVWTDTVYGPPMCMYEGEAIVPGQPLSLRIVHDLLKRLSAINMCPCRAREEEARGFSGLASVAGAFVQKDMAYQKEHAQLKNKALEWECCVRNRQPAPLLQNEEAAKWSLWLRNAERMGAEPRPIQLQNQFVAECMRKNTRRKKTVRIMAIALVLVPLMAAGVISSTMLAVRSTKAQADLEQALESLEQETQAALDAKEAAEEAQAEAVAQSLKAMASSALATATSVSFLMNRGQSATTWEYKLLREGLERLPNENTTGINTTLVTAGHDLLSKSYSYLKQSLKGHTAAVSWTSWSPDGSWLASCGYDMSIRLWAVGPDGAVAERSVVLDALGMVNLLCWLGDSQRLVGASLDGSVRMWDLSDPGREVSQPVTLLESGNAFSSLACATDVPRVAGAMFTGEVIAWADIVEQPTVSQTLQAHSGAVNSVAWTPDGSYLASTMGNDVAVWEAWPNGTISDAKPVAILTGHSGPVTALSWNAVGFVLASASDDTLVRLWQPLISSTSLAALPGHTESIWALQWAPANRILASLSESGKVCLWRIPRGDIAPGGLAVETLSFDGLSTPGFVSSLSWGPGSKSLVFGSEEVILHWAVGFDGAVSHASGSTVWDDVLAAVPPAWQRSGLAALSTDQQSLYVWAGAMAGRREPQLLNGTNSKLTALAWAPAGHQLAAATADGSVALWKTEQPNLPLGCAEVLPLPNNLMGSVIRLAWSHEGWLLAGAVPEEGSVVVWAVAQLQAADMQPEPLVLPAHPGGISWIGWSGGSSRLLASTSASDTVIRIWTLTWDGQLSSGSEGQVLEGHTAGIVSAAWSPDRPSLASLSLDGTLRLWSSGTPGAWHSQVIGVQAASGQAETELLSSPVWAPDGHALAIAAGDFVLIWPVLADGTADTSGMQELVAHSAAVSWLSWSPDSQLLASASKDSTVHVWPVGPEAAMGSSHPVVLEAPMPVLWAEWSPAGDSIAAIASAGTSSPMLRWDLLTVASLRESLLALPLQDWELTDLEKKANSIPPVLFDYPALYTSALG